MSSWNIHILIVFKEARDNKYVIEKINTKLNEYGYRILADGSSCFYLNDIGDSDNMPEEIINPEKDLQKIINWPTSGWIEYWNNDSSFLVSFISIEVNFKLEGFFISVKDYDYEQNREKIDKLVHEIDQLFEPLRTIKGEELFYDHNKEDVVRSIQNDTYARQVDIDLSSH